MGLGPLSEGLGDVFEDDSELPGPMPINPETRDEMERDYGAVDEVEYAYGGESNLVSNTIALR
jgi:hypothetical protein